MHRLETVRSAEHLITDLFEIIDGQRWDQLGTVFAQDCVYHRPGYPPLCGLAGITRFYRDQRIIASGQHEIDVVVGDLGVAACWGRLIGISKTGAALDERFADTYRVTDGRIILRQTYFYQPAI